ncbi:MAG: TolC family protein, partial [bacterium]
MKMSNAAGLIAGGMALVLTGCTTPPTPTDSLTPWRPSAPGGQRFDSWAAVRAALPSTTNALTLPDLADMALANNPATRQRWHQARASAAQVRQIQGIFMPEVTASASGQMQVLDANTNSLDSTFLKYGPGLQLNYLVINFGGGRRAAVEQALQTVYAADYAFNRSLQDVLFSVATTYYGTVSSRSVVDAAEASVKDAWTAVDAAKTRKSAGMGTELDVLQAQTGYDQARYALANAQGQARIAVGSLCLALGMPADTPLQIVMPPADLPPALAEQDMRRLIDEALQQRPDIAALRALLAAGKAAIRVAEAANWPSLYVNASINRDYYDTYTGRELQENDWAYGAGISLKWTLFNGFQTTSARQIATEQANAVAAQLKQVELAASGDVWTRYQTYRTALQKNEFSTAFLKSASSSHALALDSYKAGLSGILDLLSAETLLAQARSQQVASRQEVSAALTGLAYA